MNHYSKTKEVLSNLSDQELKQLIEDMKLPAYPNDSLIIKIVEEIFGERKLLVLQVNQLLWPILEVVSERMFTYSPHIEK